MHGSIRENKWGKYLMRIKDFFRDFNQNYMDPDPNRSKYKDRDVEISKRESRRRHALLPLLEKVSLDYCSENNIEQPELKIVGSCAVGMCAPDSDLDIAVVVGQTHLFSREASKWLEYRGVLQGSVKTDFEIEPRLVNK